MNLIFCTTNSIKVTTAQFFCEQYNVDLELIDLDIEELQSMDPLQIIEHKAQSAFSAIKQPLVVVDDWYDIPALGGFPGPYMKAMNDWFKPTDWANIMYKYSDKRIFLYSHLAYIDDKQLKKFVYKCELKFLDAASSEPGIPIHSAVSLPGDTRPLNELWSKSPDEVVKTRKVWVEFLDWYKTIGQFK